MDHFAPIIEWLQAHSVAVMGTLQAVAWLVAAVGGTVAASKAVIELRKANEERREARANEERDLRWRKAEMSKKLLDETFSNEGIVDAFNIVDFDGWEFVEDDSGATISVYHEELVEILRVENMDLSDSEIVVRDRFDSMLLQFGHIEHYINISLVLAGDVMTPLEYYAKRCAEHEEAISRYGETLGGQLGVAFLRRFPSYAAAYQRRATRHAA